MPKREDILLLQDIYEAGNKSFSSRPVIPLTTTCLLAETKTLMIDKIPRSPRSNYPDFNKKKFDYSRDSNIDAYLRTADKLGVCVTKFGADKIFVQQVEELIDKIVEADTIHEITVYADVLWDAYNSYDIILAAIAKRLTKAIKNEVEKLTLLTKYLKLDTGLNRRPIDGKHFSEINRDASFYRELAVKAKEIVK